MGVRLRADEVFAGSHLQVQKRRGVAEGVFPKGALLQAPYETAGWDCAFPRRGFCVRWLGVGALAVTGMTDRSSPGASLHHIEIAMPSPALGPRGRGTGEAEPSSRPSPTRGISAEGCRRFRAPEDSGG